jgi:hypothetical protein
MLVVVGGDGFVSVVRCHTSTVAEKTSALIIRGVLFAAAGGSI